MHSPTLLSRVDEVSEVIMAVAHTLGDAQKIIIVMSHAITQRKFIPIFSNDVQNNTGFTLLKKTWPLQCSALCTMSDNQLI
jgi:hypothetical protein